MIHKDNYLILNNKVLLTFLLVITSVGSYSGINTPLTKRDNKLTTHLLLKKANFNSFSISYLVPKSYVKFIVKKSPKIITPSEMITPSEIIMDTGLINYNSLANFLVGTNSSVEHSYAQNLAKIYIEEANHEGVNPDIAFAQMCLETGFLRFDGTVNKHQNNFCGLGVTGNGVKGQSFIDMREGVRAHIQHLKAYGSTSKLNNELVDKRFNFVKRGSATHIAQLTGKWATDKNYDSKIRSLLNRLYKRSS